MGQSTTTARKPQLPVVAPTTTRAALSPNPKQQAAAAGSVKLNRNPNNDGEEMFSPTSAAALALSTLHHFGAERDSRRPSAESLKGTRLFNSGSSSKKAGADTPSPQSLGTNTEKHNAENHQAATNAPPSAKHPGAHYSSPHPNTSSGYAAAAAATAAHHAPPHAYPHYGPDPRYGGWSGGAGGSLSSKPPSSSPWSANQYPYAPTPGSNYQIPPRSSPVGFVGPSPPMSRSNSVTPHAAAGESTTAHNSNSDENSKPYARAQSATTLVTPTPKKAKLDHKSNSGNSSSNNRRGSNASMSSTTSANSSAYSRKKKSLGVLAENFLKAYEDAPHGSTVIVDEAAVKLGVERRRIYDVVNILESISLVNKKHKNTYTWMGMDHLDAVFGRLQAQAIDEYPEDAQRFLGVPNNNNNNRGKTTTASSSSAEEDKAKSSAGREFKSLARLSQEFLQVFLVGHETLSLPEASDKIQGTTSMDELVAMGQSKANRGKEIDEKELKAAAARGLKTKIRRLYDIANVFLSVGLLKKVDSSDTTRRPNFSWTYRLSAKALYDLHRPTNQKKDSPMTNASSTTRTATPKAEAAATVSDASVSPCSSAVTSASCSPTNDANGDYNV